MTQRATIKGKGLAKGGKGDMPPEVEAAIQRRMTQRATIMGKKGLGKGDMPPEVEAAIQRRMTQRIQAMEPEPVVHVGDLDATTQAGIRDRMRRPTLAADASTLRP